MGLIEIDKAGELENEMEIMNILPVFGQMHLIGLFRNASTY